ncbi:MAG: NIPSNAP family protein [Sphingobium sp.]
MLTELRRYHILPGQMDAMHARMEHMLLPMFRDHGIPAPAMMWENREETSIFSWLVEWPDFDRRQAGWASIAPSFAEARRAEGTPEFVTRTDLTLIAPWPGHALRFDDGAARAGDCETAWHIQPKIGFGASFMNLCEEGLFALFREMGASSVKAASHVFGPLPKATLFIGWPDRNIRAEGMRQLAGHIMPDALAQALLGDGPSLGNRGLWEPLDRAPYLPGRRGD